MIFYFVIFIICISAFLLDDSGGTKKTLSINIGQNKKIRLRKMQLGTFLSLFILVLVNGLRYDVGTDQLWYINGIMPATVRGDNIVEAEGFNFLVRLMYQVIQDTHWIYIILSTLLIVLFYACFIQSSSLPWLSVVLWILFGLYNFSFNGMRQMLATAIAFYSIKYIREKKTVKFIIGIMIASSMHHIALAYFPLYFLQYINLRKNKKALIVILAVILLQNQIIEGLTMLSSFVGKYKAYFGGRYYGESISLAMMFVTVVPLVIYTIFDHTTYEDKTLDEVSNLYYNMSVITTTFVLLYILIPNADRFIFMFLGVHCLYVPHILTNTIYSKKKKQFLGAVFILMAILFWIYYFGILNCGETIPYKVI